MEEVWKNIEGYEGRYQVSNLGNVLSLNYRNHGYAKQLTPKCNNNGRLWVELFADKKRKPFLIHRLVAAAFIPNLEGHPQINHKDENPKNNRVENLEWCTQEYNIQYYLDRHPAEKRKPRTSTNKYGVRLTLTIEQMTLTGEVVRRWDNSRQVAKELGWSDWSISECCRGKRKTAHGYIWRYAS